MNLNTHVKKYWEKEPCGTSDFIVEETSANTLEWYEKVENYRYKVEPFIFSTAQFTRHNGKKILEVGVGAGTDHLQWARAGAICYGVDLTDAAINTTRQRFELYGFKSELQRTDAEKLPFPDNTFDIVYSWGVIHHSEKPELIIQEIKRVLKPNGKFIGMMYGRNSVLTIKLWIKHALLNGKIWRSFDDVIWNHMESIGTKSYTVKELEKMFNEFSYKEIKPIITSYDKNKLPDWLTKFFPDSWGWFITIECTK